LRPRRFVESDGTVSREEIFAAVTQLSADGLMFVLALDQVADAAKAIYQHAPPDLAVGIEAAVAEFHAACPDRRGLRNAVAHYSDYLRGDGAGQRGATSPTADHGLVDNLESYYFITDEHTMPLEIVFADASEAAVRLELRIRAELAGGRTHRRTTTGAASAS
jgi:hypothetical protein